MKGGHTIHDMVEYDNFIVQVFVLWDFTEIANTLYQLSGVNGAYRHDVQYSC